MLGPTHRQVNAKDYSGKFRPAYGRRAAVSATIPGGQVKDINIYSRSSKVMRFRQQQ